MSARRFLWVLVIAALVVMAAALLLERAGRGRQPVSQPATAAAPAPATQAAPATATAPATTTATTTATATATATATRAAPPAPKAEWKYETHDPVEVVLGSTDQRSGYHLQVELTSVGAAVKTAKLSGHFTTVKDKQRYQRDPDTYPQAMAEDAKLKGNYSLMNPVASGGREYRALATRRVRFPAYKLGLNMAGPRWRLVEPDAPPVKDAQQAVFHTIVSRDGKPFLLLEKTYTLRKGSYSLEVSLRAKNLLEEGRPVQVEVTQFAAAGVPREDLQSDRRMLAYGKYAAGDFKVLKERVNKAAKVPLGLKDASVLGQSQVSDAAVWVGVANKFFAALTYVVPATKSESLAAPAAKAEFFAAAVEENPTSRTYLPGFKLGPYSLKPGEAAEVRFDLFAGPKRRKLFDDTPLYTSLHYKESLDFGSCCTWAPLSLAMMRLLDAFSWVTGGNYGLAIILLVVLVRVALHPLTKKGQVSMMAMQKLKPQMDAVREKYKDDKGKLNQEMMKVYKSAGASPFLGCLPMFLQMPIWVALWTGLQAAVELRHAGLLPFWITDLAAPDALIAFGKTIFSFPVVGPVRSFNLLPLLLAVAMFLNQKFSPTAPTGAGQQASTQKQMMYFMTGFFLLIFYNAPSGLTMYIMASTFAGVAEQYVIRKHIRQREEAEAAVETRVDIPGKHFRGQKPKKPKGPFRIIH